MDGLVNTAVAWRDLFDVLDRDWDVCGELIDPGRGSLGYTLWPMRLRLVA